MLLYRSPNAFKFTAETTSDLLGPAGIIDDKTNLAWACDRCSILESKGP